MIVVVLREGGERVKRGVGRKDIEIIEGGAKLKVGDESYPKGAVLFCMTLDDEDSGLQMDLFMPGELTREDFRGRL